MWTRLFDAYVWLTIALLVWGVGSALWLLAGLSPLVAAILAIVIGIVMDSLGQWLGYKSDQERAGC